MFLAIGPKLKGYITNSGIFPSSRVTWCYIDHPKSSRFGVMAIYAPNKDVNRAALWHKIVDSVDNNREWIFLRDFNMVEAATDRMGGSGEILNGREKRAWTRLQRKLCLGDTFKYKPGHLRYSWDSKRQHRHNPTLQEAIVIRDRVLKHIDRIYKSIAERKIHFALRPHCSMGSLSWDHAPMIATTWVEGLTRPSIYHMNTSHLKHLELKHKLLDLWIS